MLPFRGPLFLSGPEPYIATIKCQGCGFEQYDQSHPAYVQLCNPPMRHSEWKCPCCYQKVRGEWADDNRWSVKVDVASLNVYEGWQR